MDFKIFIDDYIGDFHASSDFLFFTNVSDCYKTYIVVYHFEGLLIVTNNVNSFC